MSSSRSFVVLVEDVNDVVPQFTVDLFTGTVDEELTPAEYLKKCVIALAYRVEFTHNFGWRASQSLPMVKDSAREITRSLALIPEASLHLLWVNSLICASARNYLEAYCIYLGEQFARVNPGQTPVQNSEIVCS